MDLSVGSPVKSGDGSVALGSEGITEGYAKESRVDSGQVSSSTGLVVLGVKSEAVDVDTIARGSGVGSSLPVVEVTSFLCGESGVSVELEGGILGGVAGSVKSETVVVVLDDMVVSVDLSVGIDSVVDSPVT